MGAFAAGLGAGDVVMPLVTGQTWFKVPEVCFIEFVGAPRFGIGGKDVILHILGELKRNTVAFERAVYYGGSGLKYLSDDARFAVANMSTEFGGIAGVFQADAITQRVLEARESHFDEALFFEPDEGCNYAAHHVINLADVKPLIALYPSPDNCVSVQEKFGMKLDGCFIGACTTTQEDLILGAMVLQQAMLEGKRPSANGQRRVTPAVSRSSTASRSWVSSASTRRLASRSASRAAASAWVLVPMSPARARCGSPARTATSATAWARALSVT